MTKDNIRTIPIENFIKEAESQKNRILQEVIEKLYSLLPEEKKEIFSIENGTKCYLKRFSISKKGSDSNYGFDIKFSENSPLDYLEFKVECTGFGREINPPIIIG